MDAQQELDLDTLSIQQAWERLERERQERYERLMAKAEAERRRMNKLWDEPGSPDWPEEQGKLL